MNKRRVLVAWIGHSDLKAMAASLKSLEGDEILAKLPGATPSTGDLGPIKTLVDSEPFNEIRLLSNFPAQWNKLYRGWLDKKPTIIPVDLERPTDYPAIFRIADAELGALARHAADQPFELCIHLSPLIDVSEDGSLIERKRRPAALDGLELVAYRNRVHKVLTGLFDTNDTRKCIKAGAPVSEADLADLCSLVFTQEPGLDLSDLMDYYPESAGHLDQAIRGVIGLDAAAVHERFTAFVHQHPGLASHQIKFLDLLQNHVSKYGSIEIERLYEPPSRCCTATASTASSTSRWRKRY
jgi:hypothetical protein